jgi:hypothetical protein
MRQNKHDRKEKAILRSKRELDRTDDNTRDAEKKYVDELHELSGYIRTFELAPQILIREDADKFKKVLRVINSQQYSNYGDFRNETPLQTKELEEAKFLKICEDPYWEKFFKKYFKKYKHHNFFSEISKTYKYSYSYSWIWETAFIVKVTPIYTSHVGYYGIRFADSECERAHAEADAKFESLGGWDAYLKIKKGHASSDYEWRENVYIARLSRQSKYIGKTRDITHALRKPIRLHKLDSNWNID